MNEMLPLGTIIKIKEKEEKYVIVGRFIKKEEKLFDYRCAVYPQGLSFESQVIEINNNDVEMVYFLGNINY